MSYFDSVIPFVLEHEGGYCNDEHDPGGETRYGICKREYPTLDIKNLTQDEAIFIYRRDYWKPYMDMMPYPLAAKLFDCSVNMGHSQANKLMQRAAGVEDDGIIGHESLEAINSQDEKELLADFISHIKNFYANLVTRKPQMAKFINGWNKRAGWTV